MSVLHVQFLHSLKKKIKTATQQGFFLFLNKNHRKQIILTDLN